MDIRKLIPDGFVRLADVNSVPRDKYRRWLFTNVNEELMYADHSSWVYCIVDTFTTKKLGETGQPLGLRVSFHDQPLASTKCRMGRLANTVNRLREDTDEIIRYELHEAAKRNFVSIWVLKCPIKETTVSIAGKQKTISSTIHKALEKDYLDEIVEIDGYLPVLNKGRM